MRKLKRNCVLLLAVALLSSGCAGISQRTLETFDAPPIPAIQPEASGPHIILPDDDFIDLTKYVLELQGQLEKCNAQAEVFNGER